MIKKEEMRILSCRELALDTVEMVLQNDYISEHALPGQFLHVSVPGHTLRRPISIAHVNRSQKTVTILFKKIGSGTHTLAMYQKGMVLDVLGPNGNGFPVDHLTKSAPVLLIGGGIGVPPIYFLGTHLHEMGIEVVSVLGFQTKANVFYEDKFQTLGKTYIVTNDGSHGDKGFVTDVLNKITSFERYYACGPLPMLQAIQSALKEHEGYLSFEERMGCGVGACYACVLPTIDKAGYKKICKDGPVFLANEVII